VAVLLQQGADVFALTGKGETAVVLAARFYNHKTAQLLMEFEDSKTQERLVSTPKDPGIALMSVFQFI